MERFAKSAEDRIRMPKFMQAWVATVVSDVFFTLQAVPDGTVLHLPKALPYIWR